MAIATSRHDKFKAVQYVEIPLRISPLFSVVTSNLADGSQLPLVHSPFLMFSLATHAQITFVEESSIPHGTSAKVPSYY
jgi:hypothetical protein